MTATAKRRRPWNITSGKAVRPRPASAAEKRLRQACKHRGLAEPILAYKGLDAVFLDLDLAVVVATDDATKDRRRVNRAAVQGFFCLLVTPEEWRSGAALDLVAKVRDEV